MNVISTSVLIAVFNHLVNYLLFFKAKRNKQGCFTAYGIEIKWDA